MWVYCIYDAKGNTATSHLHDLRSLSNSLHGVLHVLLLLSCQNMLVLVFSKLTEWLCGCLLSWTDQNCQNFTSLALSTRMMNRQISIITRSIMIRWRVHLGKASEALWGDMLRKSFISAVTCLNENTHTQKDWGKRQVQRSKALAGESINSAHIRSYVDTHTFGSEVLLNPQRHRWQHYDRSGKGHRSRRQTWR